MPATISVPRTDVFPLALAAARRAKTAAIVFGLLCLMCVLFGVADARSNDVLRDDAAAAFWVITFAVIGVLFIRRTRRLTSIAMRAAAETGSTWVLAGRLLVASDDRGQLVPNHAFKVTRAQRAALVADHSGAR